MPISELRLTTASRDIAELLAFGCIEQIEGTAGWAECEL